jgi:hypothetical protein
MTKPDVREYWFAPGIKPTRAEGRYPSWTSVTHTTREEIFHEESGRWVVRWTSTPI